MNKKTKKQNEKKSRPTVQHTIKKDSILKLVLRFSSNLFILQLQVIFLVTTSVENCIKLEIFYVF